MASYGQFTKEDRIMLSTLRRRGLTQEEIARALSKNQSSISRELARNIQNDGTYHAGHAKRQASQRRKAAQQPRLRIKNDSWLQAYLIAKLKAYWSPEQIAGRVRCDHGIVVCHETIYQYLYQERPDLKQYLRCRKGKYRRRYGTKMRERLREESKKRRIDTRPEIIEHRIRLGDWEGDTVVGAKNSGSLITHVDRMSGYTLIDWIRRATADVVKEKTVQRMRRFTRGVRHSITYDNGKEFSAYEMIARGTQMDIYFAYPYHSWERGTNENTNGLIRQFFPKRSSFVGITEYDTRRIERLLNTRPRKRLGYLTPIEVFRKNMQLT
jgi:transposase, IS30 family